MPRQFVLNAAVKVSQQQVHLGDHALGGRDRSFKRGHTRDGLDRIAPARRRQPLLAQLAVREESSEQPVSLLSQNRCFNC